MTLILHTAYRQHISILLLQETYNALTGDSCPVPGEWEIITPTRQASRHTRDNGLGILIRAGSFSPCRFIACHNTPAFQILVAQAGPWLVASVYVYCGQTTPDYPSITQYISDLGENHPDRRILVGGDFNYPDHVARLHDAMTPLGLSPLLHPGTHVTRTPWAEGHRETLLDHIFTSDNQAAQLLGITDMPAVGDHKLITCQIACPTRAPQTPVPLAIAPDDLLIDWRPLRSDNPEKREALVWALRVLPQGLDLPTLHRHLMDTCRLILGTRLWHTQQRQPFMSDGRVRAMLDLQEDCQALMDCDPSEENKALMKSVGQALKQAITHAKHEAHISLLRKVAEGTVSPEAAKARLRPRTATPRQNPYLEADQAYRFWKGIFTKGGAPRALLAHQYCDTINLVITPDMVTTALEAMKESAPGPDRVPLRLLRIAQEPLAAPLAHAFTQALSEPPRALLVGETLLSPKGNQMSSNPAEYRPITLLPTLMRVYYKILDRLLRAAILGEGTPPPQGRRRPRPPTTGVFAGQAGFREHRSTHEHAFWLHLMVGAQRQRNHHRCLYVAFMDIHKAFDSLDHDCLLEMLEQNLELSQELLEVVRRLLLYNSTTVFGEHIELTRGALQGAQLSPLFCIVYLDDLARHLSARLATRQLDVPLTFSKLRLEEVHRLVIILLLFADDITAVLRRSDDLVWLIEQMAEWATNRRLQFSPKSFLAILAGCKAEVPSPLPQVSVHGHVMPWLMEPDLLDYLGFPYRTWRPHWHADATFPLDVAALGARAASIRAFFWCSNGTKIVYIPALVRRLNAELYSKALYPTTVVDVEYDRIDSIVYELVRTLLGLPKCTPTALVFWELRIVPAKLQGYKRGLRQIRRIIEWSPWYSHILTPIIQHQPTGSKGVTEAGPLKRLMSILEYKPPTGRQSLGELLKVRTASTRLALEDIGKVPPEEWRGRVDTAIQACYTDWINHKLSSYPDDHKVPLKAALTTGVKRPKYLALTGDRARVALRAKVPFLRYYHDRKGDIPACHWCGELVGEHVHHLVRCNALPASCASLLTEAKEALRSTLQNGATASDTFVTKALYRMEWKGIEQQSARAVLRALAHLINEYRRTIDIEGEANPITAVRSVDIAFAVGEDPE
jgi:hypothetical protein